MDNPRHKKRFGTLPTNRPTTHPVLSNRLNAPSMVAASPAAELTIIEQIRELRRKAEEERVRRQLEREQRELAQAARTSKSVAGRKRYEDRMAELEARKAKFFADQQRTLAARQAKRVETGGAAPSLEDVQAALQVDRDLIPAPGAVHEDMPGVTPPPIDPRFERWPPGQTPPMVDPTWSRATAVNVPPGVPRDMTGYPRQAGGALPPQPATLPLDHGQDDPPEGAYGGRFETGSSDAVIRGLLEEGERTGRVTERAEAGFPARGEFDHLAVQPTSREMIAEASKQPLYVTDDGEPIYMEDVIAVGGAARLRAISKAAKPIQEAFFKWIHKLKLSRHRAGKPPISAAKVADKAAVPAAAVATAAGLGGAAQFLGEGENILSPDVETDKPAGDFDLLKAIQEGGMSLTGESASQVGVQQVAEDLIKKRVESIKKSTLSDEAQAELAVDDSLLTTPPPELDEVTEAPVISYAGPWAEGKVAEEAVVTKVAKEEKSTVRGSEDLPDETRAALERTWGKWTYNPRERRDRYMEQLNSIYRKGAWLDAIAALSGNPSRSGAYIQRAVAKMEAMQMFDQEERIYNIWRDVYFRPDGTYDAPANKAEAAKRARRLGASPQEVKKIYGWTEEEPDLQQWYRPDGEGGWETTQVKGKKTKPESDDGPDWIMGKPPAISTTPTTHVNWTDGTKTITLEKGQTPQGVGHPGDWYKGKAGEPGKVPGGKPGIDFIENVYLNSVNGGADAATAKAQAADARFLQYKQNPELYGFIAGVTDDMMRQSALAEIENIIASFEARGRKSYSSQGAASGTGSVSLGAVD